MIVFWLAAFFVGVGRFFVPGHGLSWAGTYEAFAHLFIGWCLGAWWFDTSFGDECRRPNYLTAIGLLTVLEIVIFLSR